jgi:hypothetical protein
LPLMKKIAHILGLPDVPPECSDRLSGPQTQRLRERKIPQDFQLWVYDHVDWDREHLLGYERGQL